jgi:hypothetical protein
MEKAFAYIYGIAAGVGSGACNAGMFKIQLDRAASAVRHFNRKLLEMVSSKAALPSEDGIYSATLRFHDAEVRAAAVDIDLWMEEILRLQLKIN